MQHAKDSFYIALRDRLGAINPARTVILRAVARPGIMVEDAEAPMAQLPSDVFVLRWTSIVTDTQLPNILWQMLCEVHYSSSGSQQNGGLDRGRALAAMDQELSEILTPFRAQKMNYTFTPAQVMKTLVFWSEPVFETIKVGHDQLQRIAKLTVFAFEEQGD